jgi:hypothetical protein
MAMCFVMEFAGIGEAEYDAVLEKLGMVPGKIVESADGGISHVAGPSERGWVVVDVWESQEHFDRFLANHLGAAMAVSGVPEPKVTAFPVYNRAVS